MLSIFFIDMSVFQDALILSWDFINVLTYLTLRTTILKLSQSKDYVEHITVIFVLLSTCATTHQTYSTLINSRKPVHFRYQQLIVPQLTPLVRLTFQVLFSKIKRNLNMLSYLYISISYLMDMHVYMNIIA